MLSSLLVRWAHVCLALGFASFGCSAAESGGGEQTPVDGSEPPRSIDAPAPGTLELELLSEPWLELGFRARETLGVRLVDSDGEPVLGGRVSFALVGRSQDSTLEQVDVLTDAEGIAENTLIAGEMAAAFSIRVTAPGAYQISIEAGVSNAGFGTLTVTAAYPGERAVLQRIVFAQADMDCARAVRMRGDPMATLSQSTDTARFAALPAEVSYALLAFAEGKDGRVMATGCTDSVVIRAERQVTASVEFVDEPLLVSGEYALDARLDAKEPATTLGTALRLAAKTLVETDSNGALVQAAADGRFLLDSLESTLASEDYAGEPQTDALAAALAQERAMPSGTSTPEQSLAAQLSIHDEGAVRVAIPRLVELTTDDLEQMRLLVTLQVSEQDGELPVEWRARSLEALPLNGDSTAITLDLSAYAPAETQLNLLEDRDAIALSSVRFDAPLGALTAQVLHRMVSFDAAGHGDEIRAAIGCATLAEWLAEQSYTTEGACTEACIHAACDRAVTRLVSAAEIALNTLADARPTLTVSGELELGDDDGDLTAERMSTELLYTEWEAEDTDEEGDTMSGPATAIALVTPVTE